MRINTKGECSHYYCQMRSKENWSIWLGGSGFKEYMREAEVSGGLGWIWSGGAYLGGSGGVTNLGLGLCDCAL